MRYLHTHVYVSMQYGWEEKWQLKKNKNKSREILFFNCHHDAASSPIPKQDGSVSMCPVVYEIL